MSETIVTLRDIDCDINSARLIFTVDGPSEAMFWNNRELVIYCSEGVTSDPTELAGTFVIAMAPVCWIGAGRVAMEHQIPLDVQRMLRRVGDVLARHYGWKPQDASAGIPSTV